MCRRTYRRCRAGSVQTHLQTMQSWQCSDALTGDAELAVCRGTHRRCRQRHLQGMQTEALTGDAELAVSTMISSASNSASGEVGSGESNPSDSDGSGERGFAGSSSWSCSTCQMRPTQSSPTTVNQSDLIQIYLDLDQSQNCARSTEFYITFDAELYRVSRVSLELGAAA